MTVYCDASALTAILVREPGWQGVAAWLSAQCGALCFSDFGFGEFRSALENHVRRGEATPIYADELVITARVYLARWTIFNIETCDVVGASDMLGHYRLGLRLPDAIHIAVAKRLGFLLVSTDARQVLGARALVCSHSIPRRFLPNDL